MRKKLLALGILAVVVLGAAGFAFAGPWGWGMGRGSWVSKEQLPNRIDAVRDLELTDEQVEDIQTILRESQTQLLQTQQQMSQLTFELRSMLWQKDPDRAAIEAKMEELNTLRQQMMEQQRTGERIQSVLTPEQQQSWNAANANMRPFHGKRGGMRRCPPGTNDGDDQTAEPTAGIIR